MVEPLMNYTENQQAFYPEATTKLSYGTGEVFKGVALSSLSLLTTIGNVLVLYAVATEKQLQTVSNMFIVSLAAADLIVGLVVMPISTAYIFTETWLFGLFVCQAWIATDYIASTASILNLFILCMDRYWSIMSPLKYLRRRTKRRALVMISLAWLLSSLWIIPIVGWHYFTNGGKRTVHDNHCDTEYSTDKTLKIITSIFNFFLPLTVMYVLYGRIFYKVRKSSKVELGQRNVKNLSNSKSYGVKRCSGDTHGNVVDDSLSRSPQKQDTTDHQVNANILPESTRAHINPEFKYKKCSMVLSFIKQINVNVTLISSLRKQIRAARQLGIIMGAFTICFFPYFSVFIVIALCESCISSDFLLALTWVGYINSFLNPILYPLCNVRFRRKFQSMLLVNQTGIQALKRQLPRETTITQAWMRSRYRTSLSTG